MGGDKAGAGVFFPGKSAGEFTLPGRGSAELALPSPKGAAFPLPGGTGTGVSLFATVDFFSHNIIRFQPLCRPTCWLLAEVRVAASLPYAFSWDSSVRRAQFNKHSNGQPVRGNPCKGLPLQTRAIFPVSKAKLSDAQAEFASRPRVKWDI